MCGRRWPCARKSMRCCSPRSPRSIPGGSRCGGVARRPAGSAHRIAPGEASALVKTATALRDDLPAVGGALAGGQVSLAQAQVCVHAIAELPAETPVACRPQAEATMIEAAASFDPVLLARIGRRLAEIIDPDGVQARDEKPDRDREDDAYRGRDLSLTPSASGAGGTLRARLDAVGYATLASPTLTRNLADDAELVPVFLTPSGLPIDVGRKVRLFFRGRQRASIAARNERGAQRARSRAD